VNITLSASPSGSTVVEPSRVTMAELLLSERSTVKMGSGISLYSITGTVYDALLPTASKASTVNVAEAGGSSVV